ncbi:MAG: protein kinase [Gemmatimonadota bacterium]|nr:protein kinase [Gemmatimonadota bacterium]
MTTPIPVAPAPIAPIDPLRTALEDALSSQYDIIRLLGRGGMGSVYLARDRTLERAVAIKVLPPEISASPDAMERFKREARTVAGLSHPNIVPLYAFGQAGRLGYFVMGYVRGESLADRMTREGKIPADDTRRILADMADALDYAHRQGTIHRDIKPDNILIDDATGRPMLTDFGIAKGQVSGKTLTQIGAVIGTPHYMSPEQASGDRALDGRSDIYSLGVVGWAMLAGRVPFEGKNLHEILFQQVVAAAPPIKSVAPETPDDLAEAIDRAMKKDPEQRWQDGKSFRQALASDVGAGGEAALPPELRELIGIGLVPIALVCVSLVTAAAAAVRGWKLGPLSGWWSLYPLFIAAMSIYGLRVPRKAGYDWSQILRVVLWQPRWWPFWWPRSHRRPGDISDRLPRYLVRLRGTWSTGVALALGIEFLILPIILPLLETPRASAPRAFTAGDISWVATVVTDLVIILFATFVVLGAAAMLGSLVLGIIWGRRHFKLGVQTSMRLLAAPVLSPFWSRTAIAPILAAGVASGARIEPKTPHDVLRSLATVAESLTGAARSAGSDALAKARDLVAEADGVEKEIAELRQHDDADEVVRLEERIAAMDAQPGASEERRQMRELLANQLELVRRVHARHLAAIEHREQINASLRSLWLQVGGLSATAASTTGPTTAGLTSSSTAEQ